MHLGQRRGAVLVRRQQRMAALGQAGLNIVSARWFLEARHPVTPEELIGRGMQVVQRVVKGDHAAECKSAAA